MSEETKGIDYPIVDAFGIDHVIIDGRPMFVLRLAQEAARGAVVDIAAVAIDIEGAEHLANAILDARVDAIRSGYRPPAAPSAD